MLIIQIINSWNSGSSVNAESICSIEEFNVILYLLSLSTKEWLVDFYLYTFGYTITLVSFLVRMTFGYFDVINEDRCDACVFWGSSVSSIFSNIHIYPSWTVP